MTPWLLFLYVVAFGSGLVAVALMVGFIALIAGYVRNKINEP